MTQRSSLPSWHFGFLYYRMSFEPNDSRSKILKFWCPRFAQFNHFRQNLDLVLIQTGSHPNWFTDVLSKIILLNVWNGTGILFRACKSALIVLWIGHANFTFALATAPLLAPLLASWVYSFSCSTTSTKLPVTLTSSQSCLAHVQSQQGLWGTLGNCTFTKWKRSEHSSFLGRIHRSSVHLSAEHEHSQFDYVS